MPTFIAEVRDSKGNVKKEKIEALNSGQVTQILQNQGMTLMGEVKQSGFNFNPGEFME